MENSDRNSVEFQQFLFQIRLIQNENFNIYTVFTFSQDLIYNLVQYLSATFKFIY